MKLLILSILSVFTFQSIQAEEAPKTKVFLDCEYCHQDYLRTEMGFVDFVRDRNFADVQVQINENYQSNGITNYTFKFFNMDGSCFQTIQKNLVPTATEEEERNFLKRYITIGILPVVSNSDVIEQFDISFNAPSSDEEEQVIDPWKNWSFTASVGGYANGQSNNNRFNTWNSFRANKNEEDYKFMVRVSHNTSVSNYIIGDETITNKQQNSHIYTNFIKGLGKHTSIGLYANADNSLFNNQELVIGVSPAIEYNLFDYKDFNEKQLRFAYFIDRRYHDYYETTQFNKNTEWLWRHNVSLTAEFVKKWGSLESSIAYHQYGQSPDLNSLRFYNSVSWNVFKGFSVNATGSFSFINDQISLAKGDLSDEEILLSARQRETNYSYWVNFGIRYTFGSIYNNIVNPRFGT